jgi:ABC-2 type transport system ATP-binding protein
VRRAVVFGDRLHVTVRSADAALAVLPAALRGAGLDVHAVARIDPSLEDVFIEHVTTAEAA